MGLCFYNIVFIFLYDNKYPEECKISAVCEVISLKEEKKYNNKYIVKNIENVKNTKLIIYVDKKTELNPGDIIKLKGEFEKPTTSRNHKGFNYRIFLKTQKIYGTIYVENLEIINSKNNLNSIIMKIREKGIQNVFEVYENKEISKFLTAILFGKTDDIEDIKESFRSNNLSHILAISGMHISHVILVIGIILKKILKSRKKRNLIIIIFLVFFITISGYSASCLRSGIMTIIYLISKNIYRKNNFFITILITLLILLLLNPFNIYSIGMWLSFLGTIGIVNFNKFFNRIFEEKFRFKGKTIFLKILKSYCITISAQIMVLPVMIYCFNNISPYFLITNFLISIFIGPIITLGYINLFISGLPNFISEPFIFIERSLVLCVLKISKICAKLPYSEIIFKTPYLISIIIYYIFVLIFIYFFRKRKLYILKIFLSSRFLKKELKIKKEKLKIVVKRIITIYIIITILLFNPYEKIFQKLKINFLDVGQGDCTFIQTSKGKNILIDGGEGNNGKYDYGERVVVPYLLDKRVKKIDYMIISHADSDHIGGLFEVIEKIKVDKILIGIQFKNSKQFEDLIDISNKKKIKVVFLEEGDCLKIEEKIEIYVLWPDRNRKISENKINNNSLVFKLKYDEFSILFTGDIEELAEKSILEKYQNCADILQSDILKVAHHGSKSSSNLEFIQIVKPKIALIGVGKNNNFGHPNEDVLKKFETINCQVFRTDYCGEISFEIKQNNIKSKIQLKTVKKIIN